MSTDKITFYTAQICPYAQRAAIALKEAGADYEAVEIDLQNKPSWYKDVNPETKVPALTTEGQNIAESLVIIEYINDRFPDKNLLPKEPIRRARVRFAIEYYSSKVNPEFFKYFLGSERNLEQFKTNINAAFKRLNELLLQESSTGPYFLGEQFSLADIAIAPFVLRLYASATNFIARDFEFEQVKESPRLAEFIKGITSRPSVQETFIGVDTYADTIGARFNLTRV